MKTRPWDYKEDVIVCKHYLKYKQDSKKHINELMTCLLDNGFGDRIESAINMRLANYKALDTGTGLKNSSKQSKEVYEILTK